MSSWSLGNVRSIGLVTGIHSGLAIGSNGTVWVGANLKLARLDTATGTVEFVDVPPLPSSPQVDAHRPPELAGFHDIAGLAADQSGDVAVVTTASPEIVIYQSDTGTFRYLTLPAGKTAADAAYLPDGTLGVAVQRTSGQPNDAVLLMHPDDTTTTATGVEAAFIVPDQNRFLVGEGRLFWVYPDGKVSPGTGSQVAEQWLAYPSFHPTWPLLNDHVVSLARGTQGLVDLLPDGPPHPIVLAQRPCSEAGSSSGPGPLPYTPPTTLGATTTTSECHAEVTALTTLGDAVWFLENFNQQAFIWRIEGG